MMFTIERILGDKLSPSRSSADPHRRRSPGNCENFGEDAKFAATLDERRAERDSPPPPPPPSLMSAAETTATLRSREPQPLAAENGSRVVVCRKRKSMSDGEDDVSGERLYVPPSL